MSHATKTSHIKQKEFRGLNISSIEQHARNGKALLAPFSKLSGLMTFQSWKDNALPNVLWAAVLAANLDRDRYLSLFRKVTIAAREKVAEYAKTYVAHNYLARMTTRDFEAMLAPALEDDSARKLLSALSLLDCLPDRQHWLNVLPKPQTEAPWDVLAKAVLECFDHQSEVSTDIRWFKVAHLAVMGKMSFPPGELVEELRLYPNQGDMRKVRPMVRATEGATRMMESESAKEDGIVDFPYDTFWAECYAKTQCIAPPVDTIAFIDVKSLCDELLMLSKQALSHFYDLLRNTQIDPRREGSFGLVQYAINMAVEAMRANNHRTVTGRLLLRSIVENFIVLRYLTLKDDPTHWAQFRNHGAAQAKLSFLKNLREEDIPAFIDLKRLEALANEDMWLEYRDISLGSWAGSNLRKMAEDAGCKDVYDKHYDWSSGYVHGHWTAIRDTAIATCLNPLHRFHRIPVGHSGPMPSVLRDCCALVNRMLDDLSHLYPTFKPRLKWHNSLDPQAAAN